MYPVFVDIRPLYPRRNAIGRIAFPESSLKSFPFLSYTIRMHDEGILNAPVLLQVGNITPGGALVATVKEGPAELRGIKAFVRYAVPGEEVRGKVMRVQKNYVEVFLESVKERSAERINPPCPIFTQCGGCDLQHMIIQSQRNSKRDMVAEYLVSHGRIEPAEGVVLVESDLPEYNYRRRITLHMADHGKAGYFRQNSHEVVPAYHCPIATAGVNGAIDVLQNTSFIDPGKIESISIEEADNRICLLFRMRDGSLPFHDNTIASLEARNFGLQFEYNEETIYRSASLPPYVALAHFSQVNQAANDAMVKLVCGLVPLTRRVCDLYAGAGNFSIPLARKGCSVEAVEQDQLLVASGKALAKKAGVRTSIFYRQMKCEEYAPDIPSGSTVVLDPPRGGAKDVVKFFRPERSPTVIYVSCSLPELARDLQILLRAGYRLQRTTVIDMFPQTHHVEMVNVLNGE